MSGWPRRCSPGRREVGYREHHLVVLGAHILLAEVRLGVNVRLLQAVDCRSAVVPVDGAGSGGVVEPGAACWVGISGASGVMGREAQRMNCQ